MKFSIAFAFLIIASVCSELKAQTEFEAHIKASYEPVINIDDATHAYYLRYIPQSDFIRNPYLELRAYEARVPGKTEYIGSDSIIKFKGIPANGGQEFAVGDYVSEYKGSIEETPGYKLGISIELTHDFDLSPLGSDTLYYKCNPDEWSVDKVSIVKFVSGDPIRFPWESYSSTKDVKELDLKFEKFCKSSKSGEPRQLASGTLKLRDSLNTDLVSENQKLWNQNLQLVNQVDSLASKIAVLESELSFVKIGVTNAIASLNLATKSCLEGDTKLCQKRIKSAIIRLQNTRKIR